MHVDAERLGTGDTVHQLRNAVWIIQGALGLVETRVAQGQDTGIAARLELAESRLHPDAVVAAMAADEPPAPAVPDAPPPALPRGPTRPADEEGAYAVLLATPASLHLLVLLLLTLALAPLPAWGAPDPASQTSITGPSTVTLPMVQQITAGTPLFPVAQQILDGGAAYNINPAFALAIWTHESALDMAGASVANNNPGNLICAAAVQPPAIGCNGRWAVYPDLAAAVADWYRYIDAFYVQQRGLTTVETILPVYAPAVENDTAGYIARVNRLQQQWSAAAIAVAAPLSMGQGSGAAASSAAGPPLGCGAAGPAIAELQWYLNGWITATSPNGISILEVDGLFGPRTDAAVRAFQQAQGLTVDGLVGPQTWQRLLEGSTAPPQPADVALPMPLSPVAPCR